MIRVDIIKIMWFTYMYTKQDNVLGETIGAIALYGPVQFIGYVQIFFNTCIVNPEMKTP